MVDELTPNGPVELDVVLTIARLLWPKQNLSSFETAKLINFRYRQIFEEKKKSRGKSSSVNGELEETMRAAQKQARSELGDDWDWDRFIDDDFGTIERLMRDLQLAEQLDAIIDKCLKRLLLVRESNLWRSRRRQSRRKFISLATSTFRPKTKSKFKFRRKQPPPSKAKGGEKRRTATRTEKSETKRGLTLPTSPATSRRPRCA